MCRFFNFFFVLFYSISAFSQSPLYRVGKGETCAYADKSGRVVISEGKYISSCSKIKAPVLMQSAVSDSCFWVDVDGRELYSVYMKDDRVDDFSNGLMRIVKNGKIGFVDKKGTLQVPAVYSDASKFIGKYALVSQRDDAGSATDEAVADYSLKTQLWGVVDKKGKEIKPVKYRLVWSPNYEYAIYKSDVDAFKITDKGKIVKISEK
ncbi:MAG: WG repeat-containing protein [Paludibacteraceae bacterium]|nr:WG repeat-containing protein [Paludibacteraceae bacterium]